MRITMNHVRGIGSKDNDRNSKDNISWCIYRGMPFEEAELKFYEEHFRARLNQINANYCLDRHQDRCKTMEQFAYSRRNCPEETILQIGEKDNNPGVDVLKRCINEFFALKREWGKEHCSPFVVLNIALHVDESVPHLHERQVWLYKDEEGNFCVGQEKALEQAGVPLPDPSQPEGRYNNRKMVFDKMMRDMWVDVCERNGIDVERNPIPRKRQGHEQLEEYIENKYRDLDAENTRLKEESKALQEEIGSLQGELSSLREEVKQLREEKSQHEALIVSLNDIITRQQGTIVGGAGDVLQAKEDYLAEMEHIKELMRKINEDRECLTEKYAFLQDPALIKMVVDKELKSKYKKDLNRIAKYAQ